MLSIAHLYSTPLLARTHMACKRCASDKRGKYTAEMNFHFPGAEGLDKPSVWLFPEVVVCLECGLAEFNVPEAELGTLRKDTAA